MVRNVGYLVGIVVAVAVASFFAFQESRAGELSFVLIIAVPTVLLALVGLARAKYDGVLGEWLSVRAGDFSRGFAATAILFGAAWGFTKTVATVGSVRERWLVSLYLQFGDPAVLRAHVGLVVGLIILMSVAEELLWRGLVTSLLSEIVGSHRAWVWSAVLYALAHVPTAYVLRSPESGWNPVIVLGALAGGLVWGYMARRFHRLLPGIFSHVLFDWTVVMMFRLWGPSI